MISISIYILSDKFDIIRTLSESEKEITIYNRIHNYPIIFLLFTSLQKGQEAIGLC